MSLIPPMQLVAVMLVMLFGFLIQGRLHLGLKTGIFPLVGIIVAALILKAEVPTDASAAADTMFKLIVFYALLMLAAFNAVARGRLRIDVFINALLVGLIAGAVLEPFMVSQNFESIASNPFRTHFAYLAAIGFGVTYVRVSLGQSVGRDRSGLDSSLMLAFLVLTAMGYSRAAWMAALSIFALVSRWTGRKTFWIVLSLFVVLALTIPLVGERVLPAGTSEANTDTLDLITTGRSVLWEKLWERGTEALPMGQGWGYVESLSSTDLFGFEGEFGSGSSIFVFPHNDFLYLFVQFGVIGFGLLLIYWFALLRSIWKLSRGGDEMTLYSVRLLIPIIVVMLFVQLFDNGFAIAPVATRFFIAAGLVFGLREKSRLALSKSDLSRLEETS
jgi:O-antigen ligase